VVSNRVANVVGRNVGIVAVYNLHEWGVLDGLDRRFQTGPVAEGARDLPTAVSALPTMAHGVGLMVAPSARWGATPCSGRT
jgi:hypothetical protein